MAAAGRKSVCMKLFFQYGVRLEFGTVIAQDQGNRWISGEMTFEAFRGRGEKPKSQ
jgi:hypothetical protein